MIVSLIAVMAAFGPAADPPAQATTATSAPIVPPADPPAALPSGGPEFDAIMLRWSVHEPVAFTERLKFPVPATRISSGFGLRQDPLQSGSRAHLGIDIPDPIGTPVHAAGSGTVTFAGRSRGYGNLVRIDHGAGLETRYAHLSAIAVAPGLIEQGAVIGSVGSTGRSTGPHLHFEVRRTGVPIDPVAQDGQPLFHSRHQSPAPLHAHWNGFDSDAAALPQSQLR